MPELPEVEGVVNSLKPVVTGKKIESVEISTTIIQSKSAGKACILKGVETDAFQELMQGMTIESIQRRSKYIFFHLTKGDQPSILVNHLGMTGAWFHVKSLADIQEAKFQKHIHVVFRLADEEYLVFSDIRRFGELRLIDRLDQHPPLLQMAPEPFDDEALHYFLEKTEHPKYANKPVKEVIMDGHVVSGCGNIYATESLFLMGIHPLRKMSRISKKRKIALFQTIVQVLHESIVQGGTTISDYRNINGEAGSMQHRLKMYGKKQCSACGSLTKQVTIAGRSSVYCPRCQR